MGIWDFVGAPFQLAGNARQKYYDPNDLKKKQAQLRSAIEKIRAAGGTRSKAGREMLSQMSGEFGPDMFIEQQGGEFTKPPWHQDPQYKDTPAGQYASGQASRPLANRDKVDQMGLVSAWINNEDFKEANPEMWQWWKDRGDEIMKGKKKASVGKAPMPAPNQPKPDPNEPPTQESASWLPEETASQRREIGMSAAQPLVNDFLKPEVPVQQPQQDDTPVAEFQAKQKVQKALRGAPPTLQSRIERMVRPRSQGGLGIPWSAILQTEEIQKLFPQTRGIDHLWGGEVY
jgi:hypothetical protein